MAQAFKNREEEQIFKRSIDLLSVPVKTEKGRMEAVENMRGELLFLADLVSRQDPSSKLAAVIKQRIS